MCSFPLWKLQLSIYMSGVLHLISVEILYGLCMCFTPGSGNMPVAHSGYRLNGGAML